MTSFVKHYLNVGLSAFNLQIETNTAERVEANRLAALIDEGHFERPVFPLLSQFASCVPDNIIQAIRTYCAEMQRFTEISRGGYCFQNKYFTSPDAEVAYAILRLLRPKRIIEVGSGHSTTLFREAIRDSSSATKLISIDPSPRRCVDAVADEVIRERLERMSLCPFGRLEANDILFIDSSHHISIGNDVVTLILKILPSLKIGVVVHFHDIFLPFDYPREWIVDNRWTWNEQYLVQALLQGSTEFEVLWPGYFFQKMRPEFGNLFDHSYVRTASSLWVRKIE